VAIAEVVDVAEGEPLAEVTNSATSWETQGDFKRPEKKLRVRLLLYFCTACTV